MSEKGVIKSVLRFGLVFAVLNYTTIELHIQLLRLILHVS